jgi:predicted nucleic acid-binding protein
MQRFFLLLEAGLVWSTPRNSSEQCGTNALTIARPRVYELSYGHRLGIGCLTNQPTARSTLTEFRPQGLAVSLITFMELSEGTLMSRDQDAADHGLRGFLRGVTLLPVDEAVALSAARLRANLRRRRRPVAHRSLDLLIAATAVANGLTLITRNRKDYEDIPGLILYDPEQR